MSQIPLSDKGRIANSIAGFVLCHPEIADILEAYNQWVQAEAHRDFPWGEGWMPAFCLSVFHTCVDILERDVLEDVYYEEQKLLIQNDA